MTFCNGRSGKMVQLLLLASPVATAASGGGGGAAAAGVGDGKLVCLHLEEGWEEKGVDLGAIGKALALEPLSIRLNGYMLGATAPDFVAVSVTWGSLLSHFSARRLPTGSPAAGEPIVVQGRPASPSAAAGGKRRAAPNDERPLKREKICIKRAVTLDGDDDPVEKRRRSVAGLGGVVTSSAMSSFASRGVASNCLVRHRTKRSREGDLVTAALPCKRAA